MASEPDPLADIQVFDGAGKLVLQKMSFPMNTVYYTRNKEIRVTFDPELRGIITSLSSAALSVMVMTKNLNTPSDYIINIYTPGSQEFRDYLAVCNQVLNSGGRKQPRRMGWL